MPILKKLGGQPLEIHNNFISPDFQRVVGEMHSMSFQYGTHYDSAAPIPTGEPIVDYLSDIIIDDAMQYFGVERAKDLIEILKAGGFEIVKIDGAL